MLDDLKTELGRRGWTRRTDRGTTLDRQRSDETWYAPTGVELRKARGGQPMIWWEPESGNTTAKAVRLLGGTLGLKEVRDDGQLFSRFLELGHREDGADKRYGEENPQAVLDFANRYGVFRICRSHGQPANGCSGRTLIDDPCEPDFPLVAQLAGVSAQLRHLLWVAVQVADGDDVKWSDWEGIIEMFMPFGEAETSGGTRGPSREVVLASWRRAFQDGPPTHLVALCVNRWLDYGHVGLRLALDSVRPYEVKLSLTSVLGALARHLFLTVTGDVGLAICSGCGDLYTPPRRKPKRGQKRWCDECGKGNNYRVAKRIHAREYRRSTG